MLKIPLFTSDGPSFEETSTADHERRFAAQIRQMFRAMEADDVEAVNRTIRDMEDLVVALVNRHLEHDARWTAKTDFLDFLTNNTTFVLPSRWLRMNAELLVCAGSFNDQSGAGPNAHYACQNIEPFSVEIELCPNSGELLGYIMRFGDASRFTQKNGDQSGECAYTFTHGMYSLQGSERFAGANKQIWNGNSLIPAIGPSDHALTVERDEWPDDWSRNDSLSSFADLVAVVTRDFMRATKANDHDALKWEGLRLCFYLQATLSFHHRFDSRWNSALWSTPRRDDFRQHKSLEILTVNSTPGAMKLRGEWTSWHGRTVCRGYFDFDLTFCPTTGAFREYRALLCDRPFSEFDATTCESWSMSFHHNKGEDSVHHSV